jgi:hypothetical protein
MEITVKTVNNGFTVDIKDTTKSGNYVFRGVDDVVMLEFIGKYLLDAKVEVKRK